MSSSVQWTKKKDIHINVNIVDLFKLKRMRTRPRDQTGVQHNITAFLQIACFFEFVPEMVRFVPLRYVLLRYVTSVSARKFYLKAKVAPEDLF